MPLGKLILLLGLILVLLGLVLSFAPGLLG